MSQILRSYFKLKTNISSESETHFNREAIKFERDKILKEKFIIKLALCKVVHNAKLHCYDSTNADVSLMGENVRYF